MDKRYLVSCQQCTLSHYTPRDTAKLVMSFGTFEERHDWMIRHMGGFQGHFLTTFERTSPEPAFGKGTGCQPDG